MTAENESIFDICSRVYEEILRKENHKEQTLVLKTGFKDIDRKISGFYPGELIILGARPCMGKTAFALSLLEHVCIEQKKKVLVFSLQESREVFVKRLISVHSGIGLFPVKNRKLTDAQYKRIGDSAECIGRSGLTVYDIQKPAMDKISSICLRKKIKEGLDLVIVDNIQLLKEFNICHNGHRMVTSKLKALAEDLACPVFAMSQISRKVEGRDDKRPRQSDLLGFEKMEHDADLVMLLYRDEYYNSWKDTEICFPEDAEIYIDDGRNCGHYFVWLKWDSGKGRFFDSYRHEQLQYL